MNRRAFIIGSLGMVLSGLVSRFVSSAVPAADAPKGFRIEKIRKSPKEWKAILTREQYRVLREEDTERPYSSPLLHVKDKGVYACAGCELPLFTSEMKYDSGTGWPSFFTSIEGRLETRADYKLIFRRTEYHCARCEGHQGHLFDDGPPPTYQRWCNNGAALKFIPS